MCCNKTTDRKCLIVGIFMPEFFIFIFQIVLICFVDVKVFKEEIKEILFDENI